MLPSLLGRVSEQPTSAGSKHVVDTQSDGSTTNSINTIRWNFRGFFGSQKKESRVADALPEGQDGTESDLLRQNSDKLSDTTSMASLSTTDTDYTSRVPRCSAAVYERALLQTQAGRAHAQAARMQTFEVAETVEEGLQQIEYGRRRQELGEAMRASPKFMKSPLGRSELAALKVTQTTSCSDDAAADAACREAEAAAAAAEAGRRRAALARQRAAAAAPLPGCVRL
eukprot:TRINITY_DN15522_c0_g1_i1.p1 TRINITY_DN15522_c0_g1~~TRINITY_DN15522_c0_g1_i1.p1  ORF type:complete len:227 (+),score=42.75 TRINITY_DN15522_c0_g1_i1:112-792(+)